MQASPVIFDVPAYEVVDVTVVTTDGRVATADVVIHNALRPLTSCETHRVEYRHVSRTEGYLSGLDGFTSALLDEVAQECREACLYQLDVLKGKN